MTIDDLKALYSDYLGGQHGQIAIVGDFDQATIKSQLEEMFQGWTSPISYERVGEELFSVPGTRDRILTPGKANASYYAGYTFPLTDSDPDYAKLVIGNFVLGGGALTSRLGDRVRQKEGLSYGIGSAVHASSFDNYARMMIMAISNPENVPKLIQLIDEEVESLKSAGITDEELQRAKQGYLQSQQVRRTDDATLAGILAGTAYIGRDMSFYSKLEEQIETLSVADVNAALNRYVDLGRLVVVTAGDFEKEV